MRTRIAQSASQYDCRAVFSVENGRLSVGLKSCWCLACKVPCQNRLLSAAVRALSFTFLSWQKTLDAPGGSYTTIPHRSPIAKVISERLCLLQCERW